MAAGFGGELLLQRGLAMVEQQVFVVPEIAVTAIFGDEGMGSGVQGQLRDEHHHLLAFGKGVLHKVKCSFQRGAGGFLCLIPGLGKGLELYAQEVKGGLCAYSIGAAQLRIPAAEGGIHLQAGIQRVMAQQTGGTLVLGTSADYAPYEFMYADDSGTMQYAGIDISAGQYIADELGKELQVENMSFDYLLTSLAKGDFDIVMAAIEVTPERLQSADFSDPYYTDLPAMILVKADAADQYNTLADFAGKSVGAQTATTKEAIVTDQMEGANLVSLSLVTDLVNELVYGKVDAIVVDGAVAEQYAESNPDLVVAAASSELGEAQPYCIAVAKGDPKGLLPGINEAIAKMTSENKMEEFIAAADELSGKAVEVTADAPAA